MMTVCIINYCLHKTSFTIFIYVLFKEPRDEVTTGPLKMTFDDYLLFIFAYIL